MAQNGGGDLFDGEGFLTDSGRKLVYFSVHVKPLQAKIENLVSPALVLNFSPTIFQIKTGPTAKPKTTF